MEDWGSENIFSQLINDADVFFQAKLKAVHDVEAIEHNFFV